MVLSNGATKNGYGVNNEYYDLIPGATWEVIPGQYYYYYFANLNQTDNFLVQFSLGATDWYPDGTMVAFGTYPQYDLKFKTYSDSNYIPPTQPPTYTDTVTIDSTLMNWRSDINTVNYQMCFIGNNCNLWFSFNDKTIGKKVYLVPDIQFKQEPYYSLSSTTVSSAVNWQNYVIVPSQIEATTTNYCLYLQDNIYGDLLRCSSKIEWISTTTFDNLFNQFDIAHACDTVASSSGGFDDLRYGVECGARKLVFWAFIPSPEAIAYFSNNGKKIETVFPFNTYFSLARLVQKTISVLQCQAITH